MKAARQAQENRDVVLNPGDPRWARLHAIISGKSLLTGDFILSSGRHSKFLFQLRQTTMLPEGAALLADVILDYMKRIGIKSVGGMELGAVPLVAAIAASSHLREWPVEAFFVRKKAKEHGARELIDGHVTDGADILLVDDVATTGKSMFDALAGVHKEYPRCHVGRALVVIDREEGASQTLGDKNIKLVSIFKKSDFKIPG